MTLNNQFLQEIEDLDLTGFRSPSQEVEEARKTIALTKKMDPVQESHWYKVGRKMGAPYQLVRSNPQEMKNISETPNVEDAYGYPGVLKHYGVLEKAAISKRDLEKLKAIEDTFGPVADVFAAAPKLGEDIRESFLRGKEGIAELGKLRFLQVYMGEDEHAVRVEELQRKYGGPYEERDDLLGYGLTSAAELVGLQYENIKTGAKVAPYGAAVGAGFGSAVPGIGTVAGAIKGGTFMFSRGVMSNMFMVEAGHAVDEFMEMRDINDQPMDPIIAKVAGLGYGAVSTALEYTGLKYMSRAFGLSPARWLKGFVKKKLKEPSFRTKLASIGAKYAKGVGVETVTEIGQEAFQIIFGEIAKNISDIKDETEFKNVDFESEVLPRIAEIAKKTMAGTATLGFPIASARVAKTSWEKSRAEDYGERVSEVAALTDDTETKELDPEIMEDFLKNISENETAYITSEGYTELYQSPEGQDVLNQMGIEPDVALEAVNSGQDVEFETSKMFSHLNAEQVEVVKEFLKEAPAALSLREARAEPPTDVMKILSSAYDEYVQTLNEREDTAPVEDKKKYAKEILRIKNEARTAGIPDEIADSFSHMVSRLKLDSLEGKEIASKITIRKSTYDPTGSSIVHQKRKETLFQRVKSRFKDQLGFVSGVGQAVEQMDFKTVSGKELASRIKNTPGVKKEELEYLGLAEWLELQEGKISKEEILNYIETGGVQLEEVVKGGEVVKEKINYDSPYAIPEVVSIVEIHQGDIDDAAYLTLSNDGDAYRALMSKFPELENDENWAETVLDDVTGTTENIEGATKYHDQTMPGGENYREILLTLPGGLDEKRLQTLIEKKREKTITEAEEKEFLELDKQVAELYTSPHFDTPNILAHYRLNDRVDVEGRKTLFIETIQSDWHQEGRRRGYTSDKESAGNVPDAPFKKSWPLLAFKRVLRMAVEQNYDAVGWAPGDVQVDRWNIAKRADFISWSSYKSPVTGKTSKFVTFGGIKGVSDQDVELEVDVSTGIIGVTDLGAEEYRGKSISKVVGKEIGGKILVDEKGEIKEEGLVVGGEGMKTFYDKMLPDRVGKYVKKLDKKAKVETTKLPSKEDIWSLPLTEKLKKKVLGGQPLFQREEDEPLGSTLVTDKGYIINLFKNSNPTTLFHEAGHVILREMTTLVESGHASTLLLSDYEIIKKEMGLDPGGVILEKHEENFADWMVKYLEEGVAPTTDLRQAFQRIKQWLLNAYQYILKMNVEVSDDVRHVFDRMFTDRQEILQTAMENEMRPLDEKHLKAMGMTSEDRAYYKRLMTRGLREAEDLMVQARRESWKERKGDIEKGLKRTIVDTPAHKLMDDLSEGVGIDIDEVREEYGPRIAEILKSKRVPPIIQKNGRGLVEIAYDHTNPFRTPDEIIKAVQTIPKSLLKPKLKQLMNQAQQEHDGQFDPIDYLTLSESYSEALRIKQRYLNRVAGKPTQEAPLNALRRYAKERISEMPVSEAVRPDVYLAAMARASKQLEKATRTEDWEAASQANEFVRINRELARQASLNKVQVQKIITHAKKYGKRINKNPKAVIHEYGEAALGLIRRFGIGTPSMKPQDSVQSVSSLAELMKGNPELGVDPFICSHDFFVAVQRGADFRTLSMNWMNRLGQLMKYLEGHGRADKEKKLRDGRLVSEVGMTMAKEGEGLKKRKAWDKHSPGYSPSEAWRTFWSRFDSLNFIAEAAGGYKGLGLKGQVSASVKEIVHPINDANAKKARIVKKYMDKMKKPYLQIMRSMRKMERQYGRKMRDTGVPTDPVMKNQVGYWTPADIFTLAFYRGNDSNMDRVFTGYPILAENNNYKKLVSYLTKEDWDAVQEVWDIYDELFEESNKVFFKMNNYHNEKIARVPFETPHGEYQGGYFPITYDRESASQTSSTAKITELYAKDDMFDKMEAVFHVPHTNSGHMKSRANMTIYPIKLSLSPLFTHISESAHYIAFTEVIRDVDRLTRHPEFRQSVTDHLGRHAYDAIRPSLQNIARPEKKTSDVWLEKQVGNLRRAVTAWQLAMNLSVAAKQGFSFFSAKSELGTKAWTKAALHGIAMYTNPVGWYSAKKNFDFMMAQSDYMRDRMNNYDNDIKKMFDGLSQEKKGIYFGDTKITWDDVVSKGFLPIKIVDTATVLPLWHGAYNKKLSELGYSPEAAETAVRYADDLVRNTQPSSQAIDLTAAQRLGGIWTVFTLFGTYTIGKYQQRQRMNWRAWRSGEKTTPSYINSVIWEQIIPAVGMNALFSVLYGQDMGDDETWKEVIQGSLETMASLGIPVLGNWLWPLSHYKWGNPMMSVAQDLQGMIQKTGKLFKKEDYEEAFKNGFKALGTAGFFFARFPLPKVVDKAKRGSKQRKENIPGAKYVIPAPRRLR